MCMAVYDIINPEHEALVMIEKLFSTTNTRGHSADTGNIIDLKSVPYELKTGRKERERERSDNSMRVDG